MAGWALKAGIIAFYMQAWKLRNLDLNVFNFKNRTLEPKSFTK